MPGAVFVPARLNDLAVDVNVGTPARGALFYRGTSLWNALPAGAVGQSLLSGGAGADPFWGTPTVDLSPAVILAPATSARNVIQPTGDAIKALILKGFSGTHSANFLEVQTSAADPVLQFTAAATSTHTLKVGGTYPSFGNFHARCSLSKPALVLEDINAGYQANIAPYITNQVIFSKGLTSVAGDAVLNCGGLTTGAGYSILMAGALWTVTVPSLDINNAVGVGVSIGGLSSTTQMIVQPSATTVSALILRGIASQTATLLQLQGQSTVQARPMGDIDVAWQTATDATRKARLQLYAWDTARREGLRVEASGTAPMIGFLGGAAVVQQANASQTAISAVTDANAKSALQAIYDLLKNYSLAPATA